MFTGIVETTGRVTEITTSGTNKVFWIASSIAHELKIDQSLSHDGVCLTVEEIRDGAHRVTAIEETLEKSNLDHLKVGQVVNLERCMIMNGRLDGHIVQGHVDATATCIALENKEGSWEYVFEFPEAFAHLVIEKGSISLNGTSLTIFNVGHNRFTVAIIPYTYQHTSIKHVQPGDKVNIEFDMIGKYIYRMQQFQPALAR